MKRKALLAMPDLARDPAGGLDARLPTNVFLKSVPRTPSGGDFNPATTRYGIAARS
jgi:hypothetical protein